MIVRHYETILGYNHSRAGADLLTGHGVTESEKVLKQGRGPLRLLASLDYLYIYHGVDRRLRRICEVRIIPGYAYISHDCSRTARIVYISLLSFIRASHFDSKVTGKSAGYYGSQHYQPIFLSHILSIFLGFEQD